MKRGEVHNNAGIPESVSYGSPGIQINKPSVYLTLLVVVCLVFVIWALLLIYVGNKPATIFVSAGLILILYIWFVRISWHDFSLQRSSFEKRKVPKDKRAYYLRFVPIFSFYTIAIFSNLNNKGLTEKKAVQVMTIFGIVYVVLTLFFLFLFIGSLLYSR